VSISEAMAATVVRCIFGLTVELSGAAAEAWVWHFISHASAPAIC